MISDLKDAVLAAQRCAISGMKAGQAIGERASAARIKELERQLAELRPAVPEAAATPSTDLNSIPEYFAKAGICEGLRDCHPVMLIRQMATEILRQRAILDSRDWQVDERMKELVELTQAYDNAVAQCNEQIRELKALRNEGAA